MAQELLAEWAGSCWDVIETSLGKDRMTAAATCVGVSGVDRPWEAGRPKCADILKGGSRESKRTQGRDDQ